MPTPKAMMTDTDVKIISLVDKAANKKRFAFFKAADGAAEGSPMQVPADKAAVAKGAAAATAVEKDGYVFVEGPTSFADAIAAEEAAETLEESRCEMEEYFYTLRCVLKAIIASPTVTDKKAALKKSIDEFGKATTELFAKVPVAKQAELFSEGNAMDTQATAAAGAKTGVAKAGGSMADIADGGQPDGQNRSYSPEAIESIAKARKKKEAADKEAIELAAKEKEEDDAFAKKKAEMKKSEDEYTARKAALVAKKADVAKAASEAEAIVKGDGISSNGPIQTPDHSMSGGGAQVEKAAAAAAAKTAVQKDNMAAIGATNPAVTQSDPVQLSVGSMPDNAPGAPIDNFHTRYGVELDGSLGPKEQMLFTAVMKGVETMLEKKLADVQKAVATEVEKKLEPIEKSQKELTTVSKMAGLSNAMDFDTPSERERVGIEKSEDKEWAGALDSFGSMRRKQG